MESHAATLSKRRPTDIQVGSFLITPEKCLGFLTVLLAIFLGLGLLLHVLRLRGATDIPWTMGDWTLVSAFVIVLSAQWFSRDLGERFELTMRRIWKRGAIVDRETGEPISQERVLEITRGIQQTASRSALIGGVVVGAIIALLVGIGEQRKLANDLGGWHLSWNVMGALMYVCLAFVGGLILGRGATYASLAILLDRRHVRVQVKLGHPDGAAGTKPIGDLFFVQACLAMLPVAFLGVWYSMIVYSPPDSEHWESLRENYQELYRVFFFVFLVLEVFAFLLPIWFFHREMRIQKHELLETADQLSGRISELKLRLVEATDYDEGETIRAELDRVSHRHNEIEGLPSWPVNWTLWRRFTISNSLLALPVIVETIALEYISSWFYGG